RGPASPTLITLLGSCGRRRAAPPPNGATAAGQAIPPDYVPGRVGESSRSRLASPRRPPLLGLRTFIGELPCIARDRSVVARQILRQGGQGNRHRLPFTPQIDKGQGQEGRYRAVQLVGRGSGLGGEKRQCLFRLPKIPERACHLDDRAPATNALQARVERGPVEGDRQIGMAGGITRRPALEQPDRAARWEFGRQRIDAGDEVVLVVALHLGPEGGDPVFPLSVHDSHTPTIPSRPPCRRASRGERSESKFSDHLTVTMLLGVSANQQHM